DYSQKKRAPAGRNWEPAPEFPRYEWGEVGESGGDWSRMFLGEFQHALDDKGRLTIPAKFREGLGPRFIVTRGLDHCLFVYPPAEWLVLGARLKSLPLTKADARAFVRFLFSGACECEPDRQGRIMLPPGLRQYAGLADRKSTRLN